MRFFILILLMLSIDWYAFQSIRFATQSWTVPWRSSLHIGFWVLNALCILFVLAAFNWPLEKWSKVGYTLARAFVFIYYISKLFACFFLLIDDVRRGVLALYHKISGSTSFDPSRKSFLNNLALFMGSVPFFTLSYGVLRNPYRYKNYRDVVEIEGLPAALDGLKIVQISDIHAGSFFYKEPIKRAIEMINAEEADLVFFTGDLVNSKAEEMEPYIELFREIKAKYGVFSVRGNHDYGDYHRWNSDEARAANKERFEAIHAEMGWELLKNEHRFLSINGEEVAVIGIENMSALPQFPKYGDLAKASNGTSSSALRILLSHDPTYWEAGIIKEFKEIELTLSGHTHGFQFGIEIPGFIRWSPSQLMYKQWAGLYKEEKQYLYVNRGLGFLGYPGRVGILPEITSLVIKKK